MYVYNASEFKNAWRSVFDYFCYEKNLHNVLWVYAPGQSAPTPSMYYPGDDYVDDPVISYTFF